MLLQEEVSKLSLHKTINHAATGGVRCSRPLSVLLQQLQHSRKHLLRSVQPPDEIQMFPVLNVLMVHQVRDLQTRTQLLSGPLLLFH